MTRVVLSKGNPPDEAAVKDVVLSFPSVQEVKSHMDPEAAERLLGDLPGDYVQPLMNYVRACNVYIQDKPYYETGARIRFTRGGTKYTYVGSRWGYTVREEK